MRKFLLIVFSFLTLLFPNPVFAEQIQSFSSDITIAQNGTIAIVDHIVYDFGTNEKHGILRPIPLIKTNEEGKRFAMRADAKPVTNEAGAAYKQTKSTSGGTLTLKVGDPNKTITGVHTYVIPYTVSGALTYFSDHDELYWNITGNSWEVPMETVEATVRLPKAVPGTDVRLICYTGPSGSTRQDCTTSYGDGIATVSASLAPREGLTVAVGFPKNLVAVLEPTPVVDFFDTLWGKLVLIGILLLTLAWYIGLPIAIVLAWWKRGRDPRVPLGVASAWFSPPKGREDRDLTPGETGALVDERADFADIISTIVDLARRGYLHIVEEKPKKFVLQKQDRPSDDTPLVPFEQELFSGLFADGDTLSLSGADVASTVEKTKKKLYEQVVAEGFFDRNPQTIRTIFAVLGALALATFNVPLALTAFIFGTAMPRKTVLGAQQANVAKSLKNFLTSQKRQLKFQADKQLLFEKLLPFAIAFGVERIWAARFADMNLTQPEWYTGYAGGRFSSTSFIHSFNSSFTSSVSHAATPTSSTSGFSSGFSGGSSGGGGGGGGGGSW